MWQTLIPIIFKEVKEVLSNYIEDKRKREEAAKQLTLALVERQADIIEAEAKSDSWLTKSWRPIVMLTFTGLIVADWLGYTAANLNPELKKQLYDIVQWGLSGYIGARTIEKIADKLAVKKKTEAAKEFINLFK